MPIIPINEYNTKPIPKNNITYLIIQGSFLGGKNAIILTVINKTPIIKLTKISTILTS
jgi:hypothetical protein